MNLIPSLRLVLDELTQRFGAQIEHSHAPQSNELYLHTTQELAGALCSTFYKKYQGRLAGVFAEDARAGHQVYFVYHLYALDLIHAFVLVRVPGAFEIPSAARMLAETKKYDAIICIGCLLRGDTAHYDVIVNEVTRGIGQSAQETGVPHAFGVLTCETLEQAIDRAGLKMGNKGFEAALAAVEMANLKKAVVGRWSLVVGKGKPAARKRKR